MMKRISAAGKYAWAISELAPGAQFIRQDGVLEWLSPEIPQPSEAAIAAKLQEIESRLAQPEPDWRGFLAALRGTTVFSGLRAQSRVDVGANALATELRTTLGEAALGMADAAVIQRLVNELAPSLSAAQKTELATLITANNIPLTVP
jgi:hypothetical protein